jgi:NADPH2:quinone reductase
MRAIQQTAFGGPEVLELVELPVPEPGPGEVLIRVNRAGLNFADTHKRHDGYVQAQELPRIPGSEVAGVRVDTGLRVVAMCDTGGYAEHVVAPADRVFAIPDGCDDGTALALLLQGLTAWHLYATCARIDPRDDPPTVVVVSGAGGVGSLAVQLGRLMGAGRVIATASSAEKRALCLELGADAVVDGDPAGLTERLLEVNGGRPVDVVLELAGGPVFEACKRALAPMGRMVVYGISSREPNDVSTGRMLKGSQAFVGFWLFHYLEQRRHLERPLAELFRWAAAGDLRAVVGATYPMSEAARAQVDLAERRTTGKVLLDPAR